MNGEAHRTIEALKQLQRENAALREAMESLMLTYADYRQRTEPGFDPMVNSKSLERCRKALAMNEWGLS